MLAFKPALPQLFLTSTREKLDAIRSAWNNATSSTFDGPLNFSTKIETARRHALEHQDRDLKIVQDLEIKMNLSARWEVGGKEWEEAAKKVKMRKYQRAIDVLEGLVVARIFEMTKMNQSQTGKYILSGTCSLTFLTFPRI